MENKNRFTEIIQIGSIIRDKEKLISSMREIFGAEPDDILRTAENDTRRYYGLPGNFVAEIIFYRFANIELEFILPLMGESIWQDHLDAHGEGLHHILFDVDSFDGAVEDMAKRDISVSQTGTSVLNPALRWGYFDSLKKLPFIVEMKNAKEVELQNKE